MFDNIRSNQLYRTNLSITTTHSRPHASDDNPYSKSQFKTLKYCPQFPEKFDCIEDAKKFCRTFFNWYNNEHRHSGINTLTPEMLHYGEAESALEKCGQVLEQASLAKPERFRYKLPNPSEVPKAA